MRLKHLLFGIMTLCMMMSCSNDADLPVKDTRMSKVDEGNPLVKAMDAAQSDTSILVGTDGTATVRCTLICATAWAQASGVAYWNVDGTYVQVNWQTSGGVITYTPRIVTNDQVPCLNGHLPTAPPNHPLPPFNP